MMESHFFVSMISQTDRLLDGEWRRLVCEDLVLPTFKISRLEAIGRRLKRNYAFLFAVIMVAWIGKIFLHANPPITDLRSFYYAFAAEQLPAWLNLSIFLGTICAVTGLILYVARKTSDEVSEFGGERKTLWRI